MIINNSSLVSPQLQEIERNFIAENLFSNKSMENLTALVKESQNLAENLISQETVKQNAVLDCKAGCSFCCYKQVSVTGPEVLVIAEYLKQTLGRDELDSLVAGLNKTCEKTKGLSAIERQNLRMACPLLVNNQCSVYEIRPFTCRGWNSTSKEDCEKGFYSDEEVGVVVFGSQILITNSIIMGIVKGVGSIGINPEVYGLVTSLKIALAIPDAAERYLAGEPVFQEAKLDY